MDSRIAMFCVFVLLAVLVSSAEGARKKKVVIHVPFKVKKIKHTHTVYKTIHHHHAHPHLDHVGSPSDDHEHFHHVHLHEEPPSAGGLNFPDFLPDVPMEVPDIPEVPREIPGLNRLIPLYRRT